MSSEAPQFGNESATAAQKAGVPSNANSKCSEVERAGSKSGGSHYNPAFAICCLRDLGKVT